MVAVYITFLFKSVECARRGFGSLERGEDRIGHLMMINGLSVLNRPTLLAKRRRRERERDFRAWRVPCKDEIGRRKKKKKKEPRHFKLYAHATDGRTNCCGTTSITFGYGGNDGGGGGRVIASYLHSLSQSLTCREALFLLFSLSLSL